ncbi:MAG: hypothetical protein RIT45_1625 [Pseudomonadota bacterium]
MAGQEIRTTDGPLAELRSNVRGMLGLLGVLWTIEIVDTVLLGSRLQRHGIHPRSLGGLIGVLTAPFLHGGWSHLIANSLPLLVLGGLVRARGRTQFLEVTVVVAAVAGAGAWLFGGAGSNHIGASGVIFGWFGYLLFAGWYARSLGDVAVAALVFLFYGGLVWGVLPGQPGVSWQSHLFGFLGGWLAAKAMAWSDGSGREVASRGRDGAA